MSLVQPGQADLTHKFNVGVHAAHLRQRLGWPTNAARLGSDVMIDTLLLARCSFLLKGISAVSEFALYFNPKLQEPGASYDLNFVARRFRQPSPMWAGACDRWN